VLHCTRFIDSFSGRLRDADACVVAAHCQWLANKPQGVETYFCVDESARKHCRFGQAQSEPRTNSGRTSMDVPVEQKKPPETSTVHRASNELIRLIRKLRWMGMEEEAAGLQKELGRRRPTDADSVLATPGDTD
jgi:hypothetical protein